MTRADLLVLEIMIHLGEGYRGRYLEQAQPPVKETAMASRSSRRKHGAAAESAQAAFPQIEKLTPQPQEATALGFLTLNA